MSNDAETQLTLDTGTRFFVEWDYDGTKPKELFRLQKGRRIHANAHEWSLARTILHLRAENERLTKALDAVTAERDAAWAAILKADSMMDGGSNWLGFKRMPAVRAAHEAAKGEAK
jgi:hypothetical protein